MRAQVKFEWRQLEQPEGYQDPAYVIKNALKEAGYSVAGTPDVQGVWDEDKPEENKQYALTGGPGDKCISNGNSWKESEVKEKEIC